MEHSAKYFVSGGHLFDPMRGGIVPQDEPVILLRASRLECVQMAMAMYRLSSKRVLTLEFDDEPQWREERRIERKLSDQAVQMAHYFDGLSLNRNSIGLNFAGMEFEIM